MTEAKTDRFGVIPEKGRTINERCPTCHGLLMSPNYCHCCKKKVKKL